MQSADSRGVVKDTSAIYGRRFCGLCMLWYAHVTLKVMNNKNRDKN